MCHVLSTLKYFSLKLSCIFRDCICCSNSVPWICSLHARRFSMVTSSLPTCRWRGCTLVDTNSRQGWVGRASAVNLTTIWQHICIKHFAKEKLPSTCTADCSQHHDDDNANYDYSKETVCTVCGISFSGHLLCPKGALALARVHSKVD